MCVTYVNTFWVLYIIIVWKTFLFIKDHAYITQNRIIPRLVPYVSLSSTHEYLMRELCHLKNKKISNGLRNNKINV